MVTLVSIYLQPLTNLYRSCLGEAGLLPTKAASLIELGAVLELLDPLQDPVLIMGNFNTGIEAATPTIEG